MNKLTKFLSLCTAILVMGIASGCQWYKAVTFNPHDLSGKTEGVKVELLYYKDGVPQTVGDTSKPVSLAMPDDSQTNKLLKKLYANCKIEASQDNKELVAAAAIPLIAAAGKLAFDAGADYMAEKVKEMQEKAKASYGARVVMDSKPFDLTAKETKECLIAYRYRSVGKEPSANYVPGMILLFQVRKLTDTLFLVPTYLWVGDSVADTANSNPKVDLSVAVVAKVAEGARGKVNMKTVVESTFRFPVSNLGKEASIDCEIQNCKIFSELTTPPTGNTMGATISLAVVETGSHASTLDKAQAELQAFKAAVGPAAKEALTKELTP